MALKQTTKIDITGCPKTKAVKKTKKKRGAKKKASKSNQRGK
jgi:hypothetical protein